MTTRTTTGTLTDKQLQGVLDKIARLKNLADQPGTTEEGEAALHAIGKLMTKFNLTERQVKNASVDTEVGYVRHDFDLGTVAGWRKIVFMAVAEYMYCRPLFYNRGTTAILVGKEANITVAESLFQYIVEAIQRIANEEWAAMDPAQKAFEKPRTWKNAFRAGAASKMQDRLRAQKKEHIAERQAEAEGTNALVVIQEQELDNAVARFFPKLGRGRGVGMNTGSRGFGDGRRAAQGISLADQLAG